jgi:hypothetical protein
MKKLVQLIKNLFNGSQRSDEVTIAPPAVIQDTPKVISQDVPEVTIQDASTSFFEELEREEAEQKSRKVDNFSNPMGAVRLTLKHLGKSTNGTYFNDVSRLKDGSRVNRIKVLWVTLTPEEIATAKEYMTQNGVVVRSIKINQRDNSDFYGTRFIIERPAKK